MKEKFTLKKNLTFKQKIKKHSSTILILGVIFLYFLITYIIGAGLTQNPHVQLADFEVSEDGTEIIIKTAVNSTSESIRSVNVLPYENVRYLDFYYTFGVSFTTWGAKDEFVIEIDENCNGIFFAREDGYELMLYKNPETNTWQLPSEIKD